LPIKLIPARVAVLFHAPLAAKVGIADLIVSPKFIPVGNWGGKVSAPCPPVTG